MNCIEVEKREYISKYLLGELEEAEARELEGHYFSCEVCYESLKDALALRSAMVDEHRAAGSRRAPVLQVWAWVWLAAAAVVLVGIGVVLLPNLQQRPDDIRLEIARLAAIEAPPYEPRTLRGPAGEAERRFREAMAQYQDGDYAGTIPGLEAAAELDRESARIFFYLGACYLLTDRPDLAIKSFDQVVEMGTTPYLEHARLYRAKGFLRTGHLEAATKELEEIARAGGELQVDAQRILDRLPP